MKKRHSFLFKLILLLGVLLTLAFISGCILFAHYFPKELHQDFDRLSAEEYDSVFLSMYPIDNFSEEEFAYWWGRDIVISAHEIPNEFILETYLKKIASEGTGVDTIYLGIRPEAVSGDSLSELLTAYPQYQFITILANPSLKYWTSLSDTECTQRLQSYRDCINSLMEAPGAPSNTSVYFWGNSEWLIANPDRYEGDYLTDATASLAIMLHFDQRHVYCLKPETFSAVIDKLAALIEQEKAHPAEYIDLSGKQIVFFGDSIIGNFTTPTSIPGVISTMTGAATYNLGYGGTRAARTEAEPCNLNSIVNAFINRDGSTLLTDNENTPQAYLGLTEYLADNADGATTPYCFIINYGLNDYFGGHPISSEDPYDVYTYTGAFRTAVRDLRQAYPDAHILVITPNFTTYYNNGTDTQSEYNHTLADYADALIALAAELDIQLLDNFHELDITVNNYLEFLSDGCHPNEAGRFIMARRIAEKLGSIAE